MAMLKVTDLEVCYGVIRAIKGISFEVEQGDVVALIGANGTRSQAKLRTGLLLYVTTACFTTTASLQSLNICRKAR